MSVSLELCEDVAPLARQAFTLVNVSQKSAIVLIFPVPPKFFIGIEDGDNIKDQRTTRIVVRVVVSLSALTRYKRSSLADQEVAFVVP